MRQKEYDAMLKKKNDTKQLMDAQNQQANDKARRKELEKQNWKEQQLNDLVYNENIAKREEAERQQQRELTERHRLQLEAQLAERQQYRIKLVFLSFIFI